MTHTPGPWSVDSSMISTGWVLVTKSNGDVVANVNTETGPDIPPTVSIKMPALSNAHIIAAAPDMLEALEEVMGELDVEGLPCPLCGRDLTIGHRHNCLWHVVASAVKKARGEK